MRRAGWLSWVLILFLFGTGALVDARARYSTSQQRLYTVRQVVTVKNYGGRALDLKVKVPIFMDEYGPSYQKLLAYDFEPQKLQVLNTSLMATAEYRQSSLEPGRSIRLEFRYRLSNSAIEYELLPYAGRGAEADEYLNPETGVESDREALVKLARSLTQYEPYQLGKAKKLFEYVNHHLEYQRDTGSDHSAWQTWQRGWGNCEDFSLLYIALCRAVGIPARFVNGYRFDSTAIGSDWVDLKSMAHAWVEVNLPVLGWIPVDPTFSYTVNGKKQVNYDFFGKIVKNDSHLFLNYIRRGGVEFYHYADPKRPARLEFENQLLIRKG